MNASIRNGPLSPVSVESTDWSPITRYQGGFDSTNNSTTTLDLLTKPAPSLPSSSHGPSGTPTPPTSQHTSASTTNTDALTTSTMLQSRRRPDAGNPSPPSSIARSSDGTGLHNSRSSGSIDGRRQYLMEEALSEHYAVVKRYLAPYLGNEKDDPRQLKARDKLQRLSPIQFQELSTDVYDELLRREDAKRNREVPKHLLSKANFHPKRNQARQKLSTLPPDRFRQLATDVFYELERRFPKFTGAEISDRPASPAYSMRSMSSRNGLNQGYGRPPPTDRRGPINGYSNGPTPRPGTSHSNSGGDFGRPLPKTFQSNTIVPNKSTMVEDDDSAEGSLVDEFRLEGMANRGSNRTTGKSLGSDKVAEEHRGQVSVLEARVIELESKLWVKDNELTDKNNQLQRSQSTARRRDATDRSLDSEKREWQQTQRSMEDKLREAQDLNMSLQIELDKIRIEDSNLKDDFNDQRRDHAQQVQQMQDDLNRSQNSTLNTQSPADSDMWRQRCEALEAERTEQQQTNDRVQREALQHLQEMRTLSQNSAQAFEKEAEYMHRVAELEREVKDWKSRYARSKTQLRTLRASSMGLLDVKRVEGLSGFTQPDGAIKDVHVTKFQMSIDELLQMARSSDTDQFMDAMKSVIVNVRHITNDLEATGLANANGVASEVSSPIGRGGVSEAGSSSSKGPLTASRLKVKMSATANNLITACKNHAAASGLSPVSLLDAAASHLSTVVVELVRLVKICPTPTDELNEEEDVAISVKSLPKLGSRDLKGLNGLRERSDHLRNQSSSSFGIGGYSASSSPSREKPWASQRYDSANGTSPGGLNGSFGRSVSLALANAIGDLRDSGLEEYRNYLDDQSSLLVQSIQPLVNIIRSQPSNTSDIEAYVSQISQTVEDIRLRTNDAIDSTRNEALNKHAPPVVAVLEDCRRGLQESRQDKMPGFAFRIARGMKELILRVERIENGELTENKEAPVEV